MVFAASAYSAHRVGAARTHSGVYGGSVHEPLNDLIRGGFGRRAPALGGMPRADPRAWITGACPGPGRGSEQSGGWGPMWNNITRGRDRRAARERHEREDVNGAVALSHVVDSRHRGRVQRSWGEDGAAATGFWESFYKTGPEHDVIKDRGACDVVPHRAVGGARVQIRAGGQNGPRWPCLGVATDHPTITSCAVLNHVERRQQRGVYVRFSTQVAASEAVHQRPRQVTP